MQNFICVSKKSRCAELSSCNLQDFNIPIYVFLYFEQTIKQSKANIQFFTDFKAMKTLLKNNSAAAIISQWQFNYYFKSIHSELKLIPLEQSESYFIALVPEHILIADNTVENFLNYLSEKIKNFAL